MSINASVKASLFHKGLPVHHKSRRSLNYAENMVKVANVYLKDYQSPVRQSLKATIANTSSLNERNNSVSVSNSSVKLP